jgi:outer membrane murein-binding lipoprotein Lpp
MKCSSRWLILGIAVSSFGLWGCAQNKAGADHAAKLRDLEARHAKLEEDYQAVASANESFRKRLAAVEADRGQLVKKVEELRLVIRERDQLKQQVAVRTGERDSLHAQLVQFGRELQNLVGRVEAATSAGGRPLTATLADFKE